MVENEMSMIFVRCYNDVLEATSYGFVVGTTSVTLALFRKVLCYGSHFDRSQWRRPVVSWLMIHPSWRRTLHWTVDNITSRTASPLPLLQAWLFTRTGDWGARYLLLSHFRHPRRGDSLEHALCPPWYLWKWTCFLNFTVPGSVGWRRSHSRARLVSLFKESELVRHISR
jgi:hypothetical protein